MKPQYLFHCVLLAFLNLGLYAQIEQYNYIGVQTFESGDFIAYHLDFELFDTYVQGRALVDYGGPDESLYYLKGTYNPDNDLLTFKASYLVWTKSSIPDMDYCIVNFAGKVANLKTAKSFSGPYKSSREFGTSCSEGLLILSRIFPEEKNIANSEVQVKELATRSETARTEKKEPPSSPISSIKSTAIKNGENLNVLVKEKKVNLILYDAGKEDNDRINLRINDSIILKDYSILREKRVIPITLDKGSSIIQVEALNQGTSPPNTVKLEIQDGAANISTRTSLKTGETASLTILNQ